MIATSASVAQELRRRRVGRPQLLEALASSTRSSWFPDDLGNVPTSLLVLAAMSLGRGETDPVRYIDS